MNYEDKYKRLVRYILRNTDREVEEFGHSHRWGVWFSDYKIEQLSKEAQSSNPVRDF